MKIGLNSTLLLLLLSNKKILWICNQDLLTRKIDGGLWRRHWDPEWLLWYFTTSTKANKNMEISPTPNKTSNRPLMCKYLPASFDAFPLYKTNGVNTPCCRNFFSADFIFLYPFAFFEAVAVLDGLFSLVVISALYLIRGVVFLQDKLSDVRKAHSILEFIQFLRKHAHIHAHVHRRPRKTDIQPSRRAR